MFITRLSGGSWNSLMGKTQSLMVKRIGCRGVGYDVRSAAALKISGGDNFSNAGVIVDPKTEFYTTKSPFEAKPRNRKEAQASNYAKGRYFLLGPF